MIVGGGAEVAFALAVLVEEVAGDGGRGGVFVEVVGGLQLAEHLRLPPVSFHFPLGLNEACLLAGVFVGGCLAVEVDGSRQLVFAAHVVGLDHEGVAGVDGVEQVAIGREHPDGGVAAALDGGAVIVRGGVVEREGVVAVAAEVVDIEAAA